MLRTVFAALLAVMLWLPAPVWAQSAVAPAVDPAVDACLRSNAARVSAHAASLVDAADFLLNNVCAVELAATYARAQRVRFERMRASLCENGAPTSAALQSDPGDDEDTAVYMRAYCSDGGAWSSEGIEESLAIVSSSSVATAADRALAAQLILDARSRR